jgi:hypothetical protein
MVHHTMAFFQQVVFQRRRVSVVPQLVCSIRVQWLAIGESKMEMIV